MILGTPQFVFVIIFALILLPHLQNIYAAEGVPNWDKISYKIGEWASITLQDSSKNFFPIMKDEFFISIKSDSSQDELKMQMVETDNTSGIFTGKILLDSSANSEEYLQVQKGDFVYAVHESFIRTAKIESNDIAAVSYIHVTTDKKTYQPGELMKIGGVVQGGNPNHPLILTIFDPNGNIILSKSIRLNSDMRYSTDVEITNSLWKSSGNYLIQAMHESELRKAETVISLSTSYALDPTNNSIVIFDTPFNILYSITSGEVSLVKLISDSNTIRLSIDVNSGGRLTVELPRNLIDAKNTSGEDGKFQVFVDGRKSDYLEKTDYGERILTIPYNHKVKTIEIKGTLLTANQVTEPTKSHKFVFPSWIRNNADWWSKGLIDEGDFTKGIQFLIKEGIIQIHFTEYKASDVSHEIPPWIKNDARWWAEGQINDESFIQVLQYLVSQGIIAV